MKRFAITPWLCALAAGQMAAACVAPYPGPPPASEPDTRAPRADDSSSDDSPDPVPPVADPSPSGDLAPVTTVLLIPGTAIPGSFFDTMAERLAEDGFDPVIFETPDLLTDGLALGASRIAEAVQAVLAQTGELRLHIVAECNGGVATRYYLQMLGGDAYVDEVVTFVSAHHGTWLSPIGEWVTGFQSLADITPGSGFLAALDGAPLPAGLKLTSIYSCNDELLWPYETSVVDGATNVLFCDYYLGHLDGFWDALVYARILATLEGEGATAPAVY